MGGTLNLPGQSFSFTSLSVGAGNYPGCLLNGEGGASVTVTGSMTWNGGSITGFGTLNIADGATLVISGYQNAETLDGVVLENAGTATMASTNSDARTIGLALENGAGIDNQATGTFRSRPTIRSRVCADHQRQFGDLLHQ